MPVGVLTAELTVAISVVVFWTSNGFTELFSATPLTPAWFTVSPTLPVAVLYVVPSVGVKFTVSV